MALRRQRGALTLCAARGWWVEVPTGPFWHVCDSPSSLGGAQPQSIPQQPGQLLLLPFGFGVEP